jgi:hypothetical protein
MPMSDKVGYYVLCVKVEDTKQYKDIGIALEEAIMKVKKRKAFKNFYWFTTNPDTAKDTIDNGGKLVDKE